MLGNFSFGDYFKKDAIAYAWELITSPAWFGIPKEKLYVTIFKGEAGVARDAEAYELWAAQGVPKNRIYEMGLKDNFWQMGDTGPCGPCSEIHYDLGAIASDQGHTVCEFRDGECTWTLVNLAFMQFDRDASAVGSAAAEAFDRRHAQRASGSAAGRDFTTKTDLFTPLIKKAAELTLGPEGRRLLLARTAEGSRPHKKQTCEIHMWRRPPSAVWPSKARQPPQPQVGGVAAGNRRSLGGANLSYFRRRGST